MNRTLSETIHHTLTARCVEPVARVKDLDHVPRGMRHLPVRPRHVSHYYPIKGGITRTAVMAKNITASNALLNKLKEHGKDFG